MGRWILLVATLLGCTGGSSDDASGGDFFLIEFLDSGKGGLPRNRQLKFRFSAPVAPAQDLAERLKIQNVAGTDFSRAIGIYFVSADAVTFLPRLPERADRSDAGLKADGSYHVFVNNGPNGLQSTLGDTVPSQQEFVFSTNEFFEDIDPLRPPRPVSFVTRDLTTDATADLSRLDADSRTLATRTSAELLAAARTIEPGAGAAPNYATFWQLELEVSEPLDPETVNARNITLTEIYSDALDTATTANPQRAIGLGNPVEFRVPIAARVEQRYDSADGGLRVTILVSVLQTLTDDTRYRIVFSSSILGIDSRKKFATDNGLGGSGGAGYVSEFLVFDRPGITSTRTVTYDPVLDGVQPEVGFTTLNEELFNSARYNPATARGKALGTLGAFGQGDIDFAVSGGMTATLDTGDVPNESLGPVTSATPDLDPSDTYKNTTGFPEPGFRPYDAPEPTRFQYGSFTVSASATLRITGVNPCRIVCTGLVHISGVVEARGGDGGDGTFLRGGGPSVVTAPGLAGTPGPGGWPGGQGNSPQSTQRQATVLSCENFDAYLNATGVDKLRFPHSLKGDGPGRGNQGGEAYTLGQNAIHNGGLTGSGGGGGSHATIGKAGEDRFNAGVQPGLPGKCGRWGATNSSLVGLRGMPGPTYGDRLLITRLVGGSGGGSGGGIHGWYNLGAGVASGGGGGGGGGFIEIITAGPFVATGRIDVTGGAGGKGAFEGRANLAWTRVAGSGGGGAGGSVSIISATDIDLTAGIIDTRGGAGGERPNAPPNVLTCTSCNGGGAGGKGYILLMDPDGLIRFGAESEPGDYDDFEFGVLSVRPFDVGRFGGISAVTELFHVRAANPRYLPMLATGITAQVHNATQSIEFRFASAKADPHDPLLPDLASESLTSLPVARASKGGLGTVIDIIGDMSALNTFGAPDREVFLRVIAVFSYGSPKEAALGPFMSVDDVTATFRFNE